MTDYYEEVYKQDHPNNGSSASIQWKGTEVCIDLYCICGHQGHYDGDFFYVYQCPDCNRVFAVGRNIKLIEATEEQIKNYLSEPKTDTIEVY